MRQFFFLLLFICWNQSTMCQVFVPGTSYFSENKHIEYVAGNSPFILSAPHGGDLKPSDIPDRTCPNCVIVKDSNTKELAYNVANSFFEQTGCYPHIVICHLHRSKLDANREIVEAALGNPTAEKAWKAFQGFIDSAKIQINKQFGSGLFIDLHGHGHTIQRLELGYLLTASELQKTDNQINTTLTAETSIKSIAIKNLQNQTFAQVLRGDKAFGTKLQNRGYPSVPSLQDPFPKVGEDYFNGGYNTNRHGSISSGKINAIQIETNFTGVRDNIANRKKFADSLSLSVREFIGDFMLDKKLLTCKTSSQSDFFEHEKCHIYPSPIQGNNVYFDCENANNEPAYLYNFYGKNLKKYENGIGDVADLENGIYFLKIKNIFYKILIFR